MLKAELPVRRTDKHGSGAWGAPRGGRKHRGVDYACHDGTIIFSATLGVVTKIGYPYCDDLSYRYVEVTDANNNRYRYFYLSPLVTKGEAVTNSTPLGMVQDLQKRYKHITNHCHVEVKNGDDYLNPEMMLAGL